MTNVGYYHAGVGRFVCQDPIGLEGGFNPYQYTPNPITWADPFGHQAKEVGCNWGEVYYDNLYSKADKIEGAQPWRGGRSGHPYAHYDEKSIPHDVADKEMLDTLNNWEKSYAGVYPTTGRPVNVYYKSGHVVVTEFGEKTKVITSYTVNKNKWATDQNYFEFTRRSKGWKGG